MCTETNKNKDPAVIISLKREVFNSAHNDLMFHLKYMKYAKRVMKGKKK